MEIIEVFNALANHSADLGVYIILAMVIRIERRLLQLEEREKSTREMLERIWNA